MKMPDLKTRTAAGLLMGVVIAGMLLSGCATGGGGGSASGAKVVATKEQPFVNALGMKFVPVPGTKILMCTTETTVAQYQAAGMGYMAPKFAQGSTHPAVNVSQKDAKAWCAWLTKTEGRRYRLPTILEWGAAVGSGTYPWGKNWPPPNNFENFCGQEFKTPEAIAFAKSLGAQAGEWRVIGGFQDRHVFTAPVGSYPPNNLGINDLSGNVSEWCGDRAVLRGGSWLNLDRVNLQSSCLRGYAADSRNVYNGFRCVLE